MPCGDYWHWMGARLNLGCPGEPPVFTSWQAIGHVGFRLDDTLVPTPSWHLAMPWTCPRVKTLTQLQLRCISFPPFHAPVRVRAAVYDSRADGCGYPGARLMDLGTATVTTPGSFTFLGGDTGPMPTCKLLWWMAWFEDNLHVAGLTDEAGSRGTGWPVLQFRNAGDTLPYVGWGQPYAWQAPDVADWPDPWPDGGIPIDFRGRQNGGETQEDVVGLPALFALFS